MIVAITGALGAGKTAFLVYLMELESRAGRHVYTNVSDLKIPHSFLSWPEVEVLKGGGVPFPELDKNPVEYKTVGWDEAHTGAHARRSMSNENIAVGNFVSQTRKLRLNLYYTTQRFKKMELEVRDCTDMILDVEDDPEALNWSVVRKVIFDRISGEPVFQDEFTFDRKPMYGRYDTFQRIMEPDAVVARKAARRGKNVDKASRELAEALQEAGVIDE